VKRLEERIERSKRSGKIVLGGVILVSLVFGFVLVQGLFLAMEAGRGDLVGRAVFGLMLLVGLNTFSLILIRRQHRMLDEARQELKEMVRHPQPR
jgi:hypothetical protein